jgi:hypothetical protein
MSSFIVPDRGQYRPCIEEDSLTCIGTGAECDGETGRGGNHGDSPSCEFGPVERISCIIWDKRDDVRFLNRPFARVLVILYSIVDSGPIKKEVE